MTDNKKKRLSMLDNLARAGASMPAGGASMMNTNRALRSARDAVDGHRIWDLDPSTVRDERFADRLDPADVADLRESIEANGQTVPILVRRDPENSETYLLIYGRRRLEAVRSSESVTKVRAMIANMDDDAAVRAQVVENTGRRDLSFIERALFAQQLMDAEFGSQAQVAEVLNVTKSAISMALSVARSVGLELAQAIGPAHGIGRPRWEALARDLDAASLPREELAELALAVRSREIEEGADPSVLAFDAVAKRVRKVLSVPSAKPATAAQIIQADGRALARLARTKTGVKLDFSAEDQAFVDWLEEQAPAVLTELHARWKQQG
ncbi:plasmid partitioning protein RepB [Donghicola mangrovi]|uniref:Plasmid partitioning protein RepB n=1 Tax=Donghicola mangrovi TaxID=2729614 RepID=A0A850Q5T2_9RHOB|nr:plasmid partitioning protein RepB [Donghicola mangrovi]NVO24304.1 plasmid partitioning protein RepB [Donghicola mangrovi]